MKVIIIWAWEAWRKLYDLVYEKEEVLGYLDDYKEWENIIWKILDYVRVCENYWVEKIYYAIPSVENSDVLNQIITFSNESKIELKILPSMIDILDWTVKISYIRDIKFEDLLFRPVRKSNFNIAKSNIDWKVILVTWSAWSIWSELVKQLLFYWAKKVIWIDHSELWIFNQMKSYWLIYWDNKDYDWKLFLHIKSIRDKEGLNYIFSKYKPEIVFNAAAYKHVYQMEINPDEAVKTDIIWLKNVIEASINNWVKEFCQISTDKAVNPTNVMWASKRIWELLIHYYSWIQDKMKINAVRFWNVLWSSWSVLTIFSEQIKNWKDITVTHKDIVRYFMSIEEAVNLVIVTTTLNENWKIFVLDMGEPVRIYDLAEKYLKLSNAKWIGIKIIWLKPWEKLFEELILDKTKDSKTIIDKIYITEDRWDCDNIVDRVNNLNNIFDKQIILDEFKSIIWEFNHKKNN